MYAVSKKTTKPLSQLKSLHNEHFLRLQAKHTTESELLDDVRLYCKQRAAIERDYGQALQKLTSAFLSKKELAFALSNSEEYSNGHSIWRVWRSLLEESNSLALSRIRAGDAQQRLHSELKPLKIQRISVSKRVFEQLRILQSDLAACVQEMSKSHKVYAEEEKQAQETRMKAVATEEKIRRRSTDLFHSMAQLSRNYEKLLIRRQTYDARATTARNEYLFQLAAINAHLKHYFNKDLPNLAKALDGEFYEKLSTAFRTLGQQEIEQCIHANESFNRISKDAAKISRALAWDDFRKSCPLFDKTVQYQFEPMEGDQSTLLRSPDSKEVNLEQIARKLARRLVLRERRIKSYETELKTLQAGCVALQPNTQSIANSANLDNNEDLLAFNQEYVEHKVEEVQFAIRREEIERVKIEACLSLLRNSAVEVKQFIAEARATADAAAAMAQQLRDVNGNAMQGTSLSGTNPQPQGTTRPAGEGSSDSNDSSGPYSSSGFLRNSEYNQDIEKYMVTGPRPATIGQVSNRPSDSHSRTSGLSPLNEPGKSATWNLLDFSHSSRHDYQNMNLSRDFPQQTVDDCVIRSGRHSESVGAHVHPKRGISSDALHKNGDVDLEAVWSENGRLRQATVIHEFRAKRHDEVDLVVHETVVLLEPNDNGGWIKVRSLIDGSEGLVPVHFLRLHEHPKSNYHKTVIASTDSGGLGDSTSNELLNDNNAAVKPIDLENYHHSVSETTTRDQNGAQPVIDANKQIYSSTMEPTPQSCQHKITENRLDNSKVDGNSSKISPLHGSFVRTLIEFEGSNVDELSFQSGSVIRVLGRAPIPTCDNKQGDEKDIRIDPDPVNASVLSTVDDGWWEGELIVPPSETAVSEHTHRLVRGVFPSMLVQRISPADCQFWEKIWETASQVAPVSTLRGSFGRSAIDKSLDRNRRSKLSKTDCSGNQCANLETPKQIQSPVTCVQPDEDYIQWITQTPHNSLSSNKMDQCKKDNTDSVQVNSVTWFDSSRQTFEDEELKIAEL